MIFCEGKKVHPNLGLFTWDSVKVYFKPQDGHSGAPCTCAVSGHCSAYSRGLGIFWKAARDSSWQLMALSDGPISGTITHSLVSFVSCEAQARSEEGTGSAGGQRGHSVLSSLKHNCRRERPHQSSIKLKMDLSTELQVWARFWAKVL